MWENLSNYKIVLGSQSPRRVELLRGLDLIFEQRVLPDLDETYPDGLPFEEIYKMQEQKQQGNSIMTRHLNIIMSAL